MSDTVYLGNPNLKKANVKVEFTQENIEEFIKCKDNPVYFAKNYEPKDTIIRTTDVKMKSAEKFRKGTGFNLPIPITKKKTAIKTV